MHKQQPSFGDMTRITANSVVNFNRRFGIRAGVDLHKNFALLAEEVGEVARALNKNDASAAADELADVLFVTLDALYRLREPGMEAMNRVVEKNDAKTKLTHEYDPVSRKISKRPPKGHIPPGGMYGMDW